MGQASDSQAAEIHLAWRADWRRLTRGPGPGIDEDAMSLATLRGLRVLDLTTTIAGPHCTRLLADLGARVVKIESPEGDLMRTRPPLRDGVSSYFGQLNAGKQSVVLDLKQPAGAEIVKRLMCTHDVLVENFRPGVMRRLGLDYPSLAAVQSALIYCAISGYG